KIDLDSIAGDAYVQLAQAPEKLARDVSAEPPVARVDAASTEADVPDAVPDRVPSQTSQPTPDSATANGYRDVQEPARKEAGRPRLDDERARVLQLRGMDYSWPKVANTMNRETRQNKDKEAYRSLVRPKRKP